VNKKSGKTEEDKEIERQQEVELKELKEKIKQEDLKIKQEREFNRMRKQHIQAEQMEAKIDAHKEEEMLLEEIYAEVDGIG